MFNLVKALHVKITTAVDVKKRRLAIIAFPMASPGRYTSHVKYDTAVDSPSVMKVGSGANAVAHPADSFTVPQGNTDSKSVTKPTIDASKRKNSISEEIGNQPRHEIKTEETRSEQDYVRVIVHQHVRYIHRHSTANINDNAEKKRTKLIGAF